MNLFINHKIFSNNVSQNIYMKLKPFASLFPFSISRIQTETAFTKHTLKFRMRILEQSLYLSTRVPRTLYSIEGFSVTPLQ